MQLIIVVPPIHDFYFTPHRSSALGAETVRLALNKAGHRASVFNLPGSGNSRTIPIPGELDYLRPYIMRDETGPLSFFTTFKHFGPETSAWVSTILASSPDAVLLSVMAFCYARPAVELAADLKAAAGSGLPVIVGGAGASVYPDFFLRTGSVDLVVQGEIENKIEPLIASVEHITRTGKNPTPRILPRGTPPEGPELEFPLLITGENRHKVFLTTAATRGCPKNCSFCSVKLHHGRGFRKTPLTNIEAVLAETAGMLTTEQRQKNISINFEDDNLFAHREFGLAVLNIFRKHYPGCTFTAENGLDYLCLDTELIDRLIRLGFFRFNLSLGTLSEEARADNRRPGDSAKLAELTRHIRSRGIVPRIYFICGLEGETPEDLHASLHFIRRLGAQTGISLFYPVPGIPPLEAIGLLPEIEPQLTAGSSAYPWNRSLTTRQLVTSFRLARLNNALLQISTADRDTPDDTLGMLVGRCIADRRLYTLVRRKGGLEIIPVPETDRRMVQDYFENLDNTEGLP